MSPAKLAHPSGATGSPSSRPIEPLGGMRGPASDIEIEATRIMATRERLNRLFAEAAGQEPAKIAQETERNLWMTAREAQAYGLVHRVIARAL